MRDEVWPPQEPLDLPVAWWRSRDWTRIHREHCRYAAEPFETAAGWSDDRMRHYVATLGYVHACKICCPELEEVTE